MSKVFIEEESLTAIGNAIREKTGDTAPLSVPTGMVNAISSITTGGSSGSEVSVNNGVIKSAKAYLGDIKAGDLCSYSALYPRYYQKNYNSAIPFKADLYFSGGGHYANYNYPELREIIPLKDKHWLWSYVLSSEKYYAMGYFDENDDYINVDGFSDSISSTYNSMILGVFDDGATVVKGTGTSSDVKISVQKLNTATHSIDTVGTISSTLSPYTLNNAKCIELSSGRYLVMRYMYGSSNDSFRYTILTNYNDTVSSVKDSYVRVSPSDHSSSQYLIDVELLSNGNIRVVTNYYIADFSIANNTLSTVASYSFTENGTVVKYDENMYLVVQASSTNLYRIDTDTNKMTKLDYKYLSSSGGTEEGLVNGYHSIFVTEDKRIVCVSTHGSEQPLINVAKVENDKIIFGISFAVPGQNSIGTSSKNYQYLGQMDGTNVFYLVYGSSSTTVVTFFMIDENGHVIFIDSDETARCFSSTSTNQHSTTATKSFTGYMFDSVSHNRTHISKLYKDGVFMMILPTTSSTSSTSAYDYQIIYKFDKDILMRGISNFGVPALAIQDINDGEVGQAYVTK